MTEEPLTQEAGPAEDEEIRALVARLSRPHRSGGRVIERAAVLAAGADFTAVMAWIEAHGGRAETAAPRKAARGLHAPRQSEDVADPLPLRFILPANALR
jgi:hypothetical protein